MAKTHSTIVGAILGDLTKDGVARLLDQDMLLRRIAPEGFFLLC